MKTNSEEHCPQRHGSQAVRITAPISSANLLFHYFLFTSAALEGSTYTPVGNGDLPRITNFVLPMCSETNLKRRNQSITIIVDMIIYLNDHKIPPRISYSW